MASIVKRLTNQLSSKGVDNAKDVAVGRLTQYGILKDGKLTEKGKERQALGASGRAKDRAAKASGRSSEDYKYSKKTNKATLKDK
jgi:hypothetical protein